MRCQGFDRDHDGKLSIAEFTAALRQLGYDPTPAEVTGLSELLDANDDGTISYFEFLQFVHGTPHQTGPAPVFHAPAVTGSSQRYVGQRWAHLSVSVRSCRWWWLTLGVHSVV